MTRHGLSFALVLLGSLSYAAAARGQQSVQVRLGRCEPGAKHDEVYHPEQEYGPAFGNEPELRLLKVHFSLAVPEGTDPAVIEQLLQQTRRLEVCYAANGEAAPRCPWSESGGTMWAWPWLIYDEEWGVGSGVFWEVGTKVESWPPDVSQVEDLDETESLWHTELPVDKLRGLDWLEQEATGTILFVRVNGEGELGQDEFVSIITEAGFCPTAGRLPDVSPPGWDGEYPHMSFTGHGVLASTRNEHLDALGDLGIDVELCRDGDKSKVSVGNACVPNDKLSEFVLSHMYFVDHWQYWEFLDEEPFFTWQHGSGGDCGVGAPCPLRVILTPLGRDYSDYNAGGLLALELTGTKYHDHYAPPYVPFIFDLQKREMADAMALMGHEYWHGLAYAFNRKRLIHSHGFKAAGAELRFFVEAPTRLVGHDYCLYGYDGVPGGPDAEQEEQICASPLRMRHTGERARDWNSYLLFPERNIFYEWYQPENSADPDNSLFYRYVTEAYAVPIDDDDPNPAHPSGTESGLGLTKEQLLLPIGDKAQHSHQGLDLLRHFMEELVDHSETRPVLDIYDDALRDRLGRGLENVILDLHTSLILKDYFQDPELVADDARWGLSWTGSPLAHDEPFGADGVAQYFPYNTHTDFRPLHSIKSEEPLERFEGMLRFGCHRLPPSPDIFPTHGADDLFRAERLEDSFEGCERVFDGEKSEYVRQMKFLSHPSSISGRAALEPWGMAVLCRSIPRGRAVATTTCAFGSSPCC